MASVLRCDRCGADITDYRRALFTRNHHYTKARLYPVLEEALDQKSWDLCRDCCMSLLDWFEEEKEGRPDA